MHVGLSGICSSFFCCDEVSPNSFNVVQKNCVLYNFSFALLCKVILFWGSRYLGCLGSGLCMLQFALASIVGIDNFLHLCTDMHYQGLPFIWLFLQPLFCKVYVSFGTLLRGKECVRVWVGC